LAGHITPVILDLDRGIRVRSEIQTPYLQDQLNDASGAIYRHEGTADAPDGHTAWRGFWLGDYPTRAQNAGLRIYVIEYGLVKDQIELECTQLDKAIGYLDRNRYSLARCP
jgi:hypothetical protein